MWAVEQAVLLTIKVTIAPLPTVLGWRSKAELVGPAAQARSTGFVYVCEVRETAFGSFGHPVTTLKIPLRAHELGRVNDRVEHWYCTPVTCIVLPVPVLPIGDVNVNVKLDVSQRYTTYRYRYRCRYRSQVTYMGAHI